MAFLSLILCYLLFGTDNARGHMPNVYEFCSYVLAEKRNATDSASCLQCQGFPGKRGPVGIRGFRGFKGDRGEEGTYDRLEQKISRLEALTECTLGMKNRAIKDSQITTSSDWDANHAGKYGRLDEPPRIVGAWCAKQLNVHQWIRVDLLRLRKIVGFITQGRSQVNQWVKSYKVGCGNSVAGITKVLENGSEKVFMANYDKDIKVYNLLPIPQTCRYVSIFPQTWNNHISMRMEILGGDCF